MNQKKTLFFIAGIALLVILLLGLILYSVFSPSEQRGIENLPTPTPVSTGGQSADGFRFTPLQETAIGLTTEKQIEENESIINKREESGKTIYAVTSSVPIRPNSIEVKDGVVVSEYTNTKTNEVPLLKITTIEDKFGEPEEVIDRVGDGFEVSAYLYPEKGFALYANRYTGTVYNLHRFIPMSLAKYKQEYSDFIQPAPEPPKEGIGL